MDFHAALKNGPLFEGQKPSVAAPKPVVEEEKAEESKSQALVLLNVRAVKTNFARYDLEIESMAIEADRLKVTDAESQNSAVVIGGAAAKLKKAIEAKRKETIADAEAFVKGVNNFCKTYTERLGSIERDLKEKLSTYQYNIELERKKAEAAQKRLAEELQTKLNRDAEEANKKAAEEVKAAGQDPETLQKIEAPQVVMPIVPESKNTVRTDTGVSSYGTKRWVGEVYDPSAVPREYCSPDQGLINDAVKSGVRAIPGVNIHEKRSTSFRT